MTFYILGLSFLAQIPLALMYSGAELISSAVLYIQLILVALSLYFAMQTSIQVCIHLESRGYVSINKNQELSLLLNSFKAVCGHTLKHNWICLKLMILGIYVP